MYGGGNNRFRIILALTDGPPVVAPTRHVRQGRYGSLVSVMRLSQNGSHGGLRLNVSVRRRQAHAPPGGTRGYRCIAIVLGLAAVFVFVFGNHAFEFFFRKVKNFGRQGFVRVHIPVQRRIPNVGSNIVVVVIVITISVFGIACVVHLEGLFGGGLATSFLAVITVVIGFAVIVVGGFVLVLFFDSFFSFHVPVSFANKLGQDHVKSLVPSPSSG